MRTSPQDSWALVRRSRQREREVRRSEVKLPALAWAPEAPEEGHEAEEMADPGRSSDLARILLPLPRENERFA